MNDEQDEFPMNDNRWLTDCCGAPIKGELCGPEEGNTSVGLCSRCLEWSGVTRNPECGEETA